MGKDKLHVWTVANGITFLRLLMTFPIVGAIVRSESGATTLGFTLFLIAGLSDGVDGYVARRRNETTSFGAMLDPVADKVLGVAVLAAFVWVGGLPGWMFWTLTAKEVLLLLGGVLLLGRFGRTIEARLLGKVATIVLFSGFACLLAGWNAFGYGLCFSGVVFSLGAGVDYGIHALSLRNNSSVRGDD